MMRLKPIGEQVVVVFGASSGMGREAARRFARRGAKVVVAARSEPGLRSLVEEIRLAGGDATAVVADVTEFAQVEVVADTAVEVYGRIDTWVQLASVGIWATFEQTTPAEFKQIVDVNLTGQAYGAMAALPHLRHAGQGALILISSVEAVLPVPLQSAYAASKHGVNGMIDVLRLELEHEGVPISVTNVYPAGINTPFFNKAGSRIGVKPKPIPPIYQPNLAVAVILHAAEHPTRSIGVGGGAWLAMLLRRKAPRLVELMLRATAFRLQRSNDPKPMDAPNNIFRPISGFDRGEGDYGGQARSWSLYTWWAIHPGWRKVVTGALLGLTGMLLVTKRLTAGGGANSC